MPYSSDQTILHYRRLLADFEYELRVQARRGGEEIEVLAAAVERTRNTIANLLKARAGLRLPSDGIACGDDSSK